MEDEGIDLKSVLQEVFSQEDAAAAEERIVSVLESFEDPVITQLETDIDEHTRILKITMIDSMMLSERSLEMKEFRHQSVPVLFIAQELNSAKSFH